MSRSRKKPIVGICCKRLKDHRKSKKRMTKLSREKFNDLEEDLINGAYYKKWLHSWRWRPDDGKKYWDEESSYRK